MLCCEVFDCSLIGAVRDKEPGLVEGSARFAKTRYMRTKQYLPNGLNMTICEQVLKGIGNLGRLCQER